LNDKKTNDYHEGIDKRLILMHEIDSVLFDKLKGGGDDKKQETKKQGSNKNDTNQSSNSQSLQKLV